MALLNREGHIDAVLTDDVDAFAFGAKRIIRKGATTDFPVRALLTTTDPFSSSLRLSANKSNPALNADGKESKYHTIVFDADAIRNHPNIQLTRGGIILFALLSGGDYDTVRFSLCERWNPHTQSALRAV